MISDNRKGWITVEMMSVLGILLLIGGGLAMLLRTTGRYNAEQMARMRCLAAAQAQLDNLVVTGQGLRDEEVQRLWPGVTLQVERADGAGDWQGLNRIEVIATRGLRSSRRTVRVRLVRYVRMEGGRP